MTGVSGFSISGTASAMVPSAATSSSRSAVSPRGSHIGWGTANYCVMFADDYIELINPLWTTKELRGRVEEIRPEGTDAATVWIRPGYEWQGHKPGQYVRLGLVIDGT